MTQQPNGPAADPSAATPATSFLAELRSSERAPEGHAVLTTRRARRIPLHLLVACVVLTMGCAALLGMRHMGMKAGMTFETDSSLLPVSAPGTKDALRLAAVMDDLEHSQSPATFSHARPEKNPFSFAGHPTKPEESPRDDGAELAEREAEARRHRQEQLEASLASMRLNGIIGGRNSYIASIGDKTFRVGDVIDEIFTVTEIDGRTVTVAADEQLFELTVGQETAKPVKKKPAKAPTKPVK